MYRSIVRMSIPDICAWCGSSKTIKSISVLATHKEEAGFLVRKTRLQSLNLKIPICNACYSKMERGDKIGITLFFIIGIVGSAAFLWLGNFLGENLLFCFLFGCIFSFGVGASLSNSIPKMLGYPSKKSWGRFDGRKLFIKNDDFANHFYSLNPDLSPRGQHLIR